MFICTGSAKGVEIRRVQYDNGNLTLGGPNQLTPNARNFQFSPDFKYVAIFTKTGIHSQEFPDKVIQICEYNSAQGTINQIRQVDVPNIVSVKFSPKSKYFAVILRKNTITVEKNIPLIQIYETRGPLVRAFNYSAIYAPSLFWSDDESIFCCSYSNGVKFFQNKEDGTVEEKSLELPNILACDFTSANGKIRFAVIYNDGTMNAKRMKIYEYPNLEKHLSTRPVMVGEQFTIKISPNGQSAIAIGIKNQSDETYFGSSFAYYLNVQGQNKLTMKKSGPIHCVEYSKTGDKFVLIAGHVPPNVAVHFDRIGTLYDVGEFSFNSARFSPFHDLVAFAGFGNFAGAVKVFNTQRRETVADGEALYTSEWSWSPCGRLFLTAVLFPKMMVSNEFRIHNHGIQVLQSVKMEELTQCEWVGLPNEQPLPKIDISVSSKPQSSSYVPPHLRAKMQQQQEQQKPKPAPGPAPKYPPGYKK